MALSEVLYISHVTCYINFQPLSVWPTSQSVSLNLTVLSSPALTIIQRVVLSSVLSFKLTTLQVLISPPKQRLFSIRYFYHKTSVCLWLLSPHLSVCTYYYYYYIIIALLIITYLSHQTTHHHHLLPTLWSPASPDQYCMTKSTRAWCKLYVCFIGHQQVTSSLEHSLSGSISSSYIKLLNHSKARDFDKLWYFTFLQL